MSDQAVKEALDTPPSAMDKFLNFIEKAGNKIPDPALLFFWGLLIVWGLSALLSQFEFGLIHP
ncbi:AbgT family transporter, partial [Vibrio natriegens]